MLVLAFSFVVASLLSFRFSNFAVRLLYWLAAVWLGFLNFFFWASCVVWIAWLALQLSTNSAAIRTPLAGTIYAIAAAAGNLRPHQRAGDSHSPRDGEDSQPARGVAWPQSGSAQRFASRAYQRSRASAAVWWQWHRAFSPTLYLLPGDVFDGTHSDLDRLIAPLRALTPRRSAFTSLPATTRSSPIPRITSTPSRGAGHPRSRQRAGRSGRRARSRACSIATPRISSA